MAGIRLNGQSSPYRARTFLYGNWTQPQTIQLIAIEFAGETKPLAVIVDYEY